MLLHIGWLTGSHNLKHFSILKLFNGTKKTVAHSNQCHQLDNNRSACKIKLVTSETMHLQQALQGSFPLFSSHIVICRQSNIIKYCYGDQFKEDEMGGTCSTQGGDDKCMQYSGRKTWGGRDHTEDLGVHMKTNIIISRLSP
jgi:hypothetical protein